MNMSYVAKLPVQFESPIKSLRFKKDLNPWFKFEPTVGSSATLQIH